MKAIVVHEALCATLGMKRSSRGHSEIVEAQARYLPYAREPSVGVAKLRWCYFGQTSPL